MADPPGALLVLLILLALGLLLELVLRLLPLTWALVTGALAAARTGAAGTVGGLEELDRLVCRRGLAAPTGWRPLRAAWAV
jgi:hypothetical protein